MPSLSTWKQLTHWRSIVTRPGMRKTNWSTPNNVQPVWLDVSLTIAVMGVPIINKYVNLMTVVLIQLILMYLSSICLNRILNVKCCLICVYSKNYILVSYVLCCIRTSLGEKYTKVCSSASAASNTKQTV